MPKRKAPPAPEPEPVEQEQEPLPPPPVKRARVSKKPARLEDEAEPAPAHKPRGKKTAAAASSVEEDEDPTEIVERKPAKKPAARGKKAAAAAAPSYEEEGGDEEMAPPTKKPRARKAAAAKPPKAPKPPKMTKAEKEAAAYAEAIAAGQPPPARKGKVYYKGGGPVTEGASLERNRLIAEYVAAVGDAMKDAGANIFDARRKWEAAKAIRGAEFPITHGKQATDALSGVGKGTAKLIDEFLTTGTMAEAASVLTPRVILTKQLLAKLPGVEKKVIERFVDSHDVTSVDEVVALAHTQPEAIDAQLLPHLRHLSDTVPTVPRAIVAALDAQMPGILKEVTKALPGKQALQYVIAGGYRRGLDPVPTTSGVHVLLTSPEYITPNAAHSERAKPKASEFPVLDRLAGVLRTHGILSRSEITAVRENKGDDYFEAWIRVPGPGEAAPKTEPAEPGYNLRNTGVGGMADLPPLEEAGEEAEADDEGGGAGRGGKKKGGHMKPDYGAASSSSSSSSSSGKRHPGGKEGYFLARFSVVPHNCFGFYCVVETGPYNFIEGIKQEVATTHGRGHRKVLQWSKSAWIPLLAADDPMARGNARGKKNLEVDDEDFDAAAAAGSGKKIASREGMDCYTEEDFFEQAGYDYVPPEERH